MFTLMARTTQWFSLITTMKSTKVQNSWHILYHTSCAHMYTNTHTWKLATPFAVTALLHWCMHLRVRLYHEGPPTQLHTVVFFSLKHRLAASVGIVQDKASGYVDLEYMKTIDTTYTSPYVVAAVSEPMATLSQWEAAQFLCICMALPRVKGQHVTDRIR